MTPEEMKMLGASDASALLGVNKNRTAWDVYNRIVNGIDTPDNKLLRRGRLMEPVIRAMAEEDLGLRLVGPQSLRDERRPWLRMSLDDAAIDDAEEVPVEYKSVIHWAADDYGDSGTDHVPEMHILQTQVYCHGKEAKRAHLVALIGLDDLRHYIIPAEPNLQGVVLEAMERFWVDHIKPQRPPPIDGSAGCSEWLAKRFPKQSKTFINADDEAERIAREYHVARQAREAAEAREADCRNHLINKIGEAEGIAGEGWKITYRFANGRTGIDKEALERDGLLAKYTKRGSGGRRFCPKFPGMEEPNE